MCSVHITKKMGPCTWKLLCISAAAKLVIIDPAIGCFLEMLSVIAWLAGNRSVFIMSFLHDLFLRADSKPMRSTWVDSRKFKLALECFRFCALCKGPSFFSRLAICMHAARGTPCMFIIVRFDEGDTTGLLGLAASNTIQSQDCVEFRRARTASPEISNGWIAVCAFV